MAKIGFIVRGCKGHCKYYSPNVKWFVDLSCGLVSLGYEAVLYIEESEKHLKDKILSLNCKSIQVVFFNKSNLEESLQRFSTDYLIVDDDIPYMRKVLHLRLPSTKTGVFVQYLYGVNTNSKKKRSSSSKSLIGSLLPWRFVIRRYKKLLSLFDYIIPNSQTCGYILSKFYDIPISEVVYPPVGNDMRRLIEDSRNSPDKKGILIFVGNIELDYFTRDLKEEIIKMRKELQEPIKIFATDKVTAEYFTKQGFQTNSNLPVEELVRLYQNSRITYVPTAYELFGHVGAESILCGTPVILDTYHPFLEMFPMETKAVRIANPKSAISDVIKEMLQEDIDIETAQKAVLQHYSVVTSAESLIKALCINCDRSLT